MLEPIFDGIRETDLRGHWNLTLQFPFHFLDQQHRLFEVTSLGALADLLATTLELNPQWATTLHVVGVLRRSPRNDGGTA